MLQSKVGKERGASILSVEQRNELQQRQNEVINKEWLLHMLASEHAVNCTDGGIFNRLKRERESARR